MSGSELSPPLSFILSALGEWESLHSYCSLEKETFAIKDESSSFV